MHDSRLGACTVLTTIIGSAGAVGVAALATAPLSELDRRLVVALATIAVAVSVAALTVTDRYGGAVAILIRRFGVWRFCRNSAAVACLLVVAVVEVSPYRHGEIGGVRILPTLVPTAVMLTVIGLWVALLVLGARFLRARRRRNDATMHGSRAVAPPAASGVKPSTTS